MAGRILIVDDEPEMAAQQDEETLRVALHHEARAATSLREAAGREIDRNLFAAALLNRLEKWFAVARARDWDALLAGWRERDGLRDHRVEIRGAGPARQGRARGTSASRSRLSSWAISWPRSLFGGTPAPRAGQW